MSDATQPLLQASQLGLHFPTANDAAPNHAAGFGPLNLSLFGGQLVVLLGESGSGKTLLLDVIAGRRRADRGSLRVGTHQIDFEVTDSGMPKTAFNPIGSASDLKYISVLDPRPAAPSLKVLFSQVFPAGQKAPLDRWQDQIVQQLGLASLLDLAPAQLSSGQWQLCQWAMAMFSKPQVILADHTTCFLPQTRGTALAQTLLDYVQRTQTLLLCATNDPNLTRAADQLLFLVNGELTQLQVNARPNADGVGFAPADVSRFGLANHPPTVETEAPRQASPQVAESSPRPQVLVNPPQTGLPVPSSANAPAPQLQPPTILNQLFTGELSNAFGILGAGTQVVPQHLQTVEGARKYLDEHRVNDTPAGESRHYPPRRQRMQR